MAVFSIDMMHETFMIAPFGGVSRPNTFLGGQTETARLTVSRREIRWHDAIKRDMQ